MLSKHVLATVAYYDVLGYCLSEFEAWKHLIVPRGGAGTVPPDLRSVIDAADALVVEGRLVRQDGFLVLPGRRHLITERIRGEKRAVAKIKRAVRLIRSLAWVPFVRMIALTGSLSLKQTDAESDWDLFVVLRRGAIWRGRTLLTGALHLLGKRRHGRHVRNRACLNCFVTDGSRELALKDLFSAHEYRFMLPVIGGGEFRRFELANRWMAEFKPTFRPTEIAPAWLQEEHRLSLRLRSGGERIFSSEWIETWLSRWQRRKIERNPNTALPGGYIEATDEALIFLPHPKGPVVFEQYKDRLSTLGLAAPPS
jgi:hypothetical protein